jgi:Kef-type K+ transport system membrane component KefB
LTSAALVSVLAFLAPLFVRLTRVPLPDIVVQIGLGVLVGPQVLGWASVDEPVQVLSVIGLSFLLFLAGFEIDFERLRGRTARLAITAFGLSFALAFAIGGILGATHLVQSPLLIAIILAATALGVIIPVLKDSGEIDSPVGRLVLAGASIAEVVPVVLLSLLFSEQTHDLGAKIGLLAAFSALVVAAGLAILGLERWPWISNALLALQDTTAEIRVRAAVALLMGFAALATQFGLEAILGAFLAGATISLLDRDPGKTHALFRTKLEAVGFGAFIPYFFISAGMTLDLRSFADHATTLVRVPIFLTAILVARAVPTLLYRSQLANRAQTLAAGLLQSTTLSIPIVGGSIGVHLSLIQPENYVALVLAGLLSVISFPVLADLLLRADNASTGRTASISPK